MKTERQQNRHGAEQLFKTSFAEVYPDEQVIWTTYVSRETEDN